jgi:carboxylesterase type B
VTIAGQSAGAWSALSHVVSNINLGRRGLIMSSPVFNFSSPQEAQSTFDRLISRIDVPESASGLEKVEALRRISEEQMNELIKGEILVRPLWDSEWFGREETPTRLDQIGEFPKWVDGLIMGCVKNETALSLPLWRNWSQDHFLDAFSSVVEESRLAHDIQEVYNISNTVGDALLGNFLNFSADSLYRAIPPYFARNTKLPICIYSFEQLDTCESSEFHKFSYHCLDLAFLFRVPFAIGKNASNSMRQTADKMSETFIAFFNGKQPWKPFESSSETVMIYKGTDSGLVIWSEKDEPSRQFVSKIETQRSFIDAGYLSVTYSGSKN